MSPFINASALQKKQARRSLAEINAILQETSSDDHGDDPDPQQPATHYTQPEHPMMAFINLMLKDLNVQQDAPLSSHASSDTTSTSAGSPAPPPSLVTRYLESECFTKIVQFCTFLPDWPQLQALIQHYLWHVDWKFLITNQDLLEAHVKDVYTRIILPVQSSDHGAATSTSVSAAMAFQPGDLPRLALLASVLGETIETLSLEAIAMLLPISRQSSSADDVIKLGVASSPRVKVLSLITHHIHVLIEECVRLDEMTIDLVQANISAFSLWTNQGLHGTGPANFPRWNVTIRAAQACKLFEDPGSNAGYTRVELDHRRRLAWLVYGYDHAFAVGANTKPLIVESQFSVDQPSDASPWSASGAPPDPCLAFLEAQGGRIAQLVSSTLCFGPPLHRKAMETDKQIMDTLSRVHPSYNWDRPDLSFDTIDPFRARRRCWVQLTTAWQRGSLHRQFFFPNGRITNGELAASRHIATDSAIRSIIAVRELRKLQNRFSDRMGSAWWYQYFTEPCMTLATAALLLIRSKGQGIPGLSDQASCWTRVMHFTQTIDGCLQDLEASIQDPSLCLPTLLSFGKGCIRLIQQLRGAVQASLEALIKSQPGTDALKSLSIDENILPLLHPRSRDKSSGSQSPTHINGSGRTSTSSSDGSRATKRQGVKRATTTSSQPSRSRKSIDLVSRSPLDGSSGQAMIADSLSVSPRTSADVSLHISDVSPSAHQMAAASLPSYGLQDATFLAHSNSIASVSPEHSSPETNLSQLHPDTLSLSLGSGVSFTGCASTTVSRAEFDDSLATLAHQQQYQLQPGMSSVASATYHVATPTAAATEALQQPSPAEPFALRDFYSNNVDQRPSFERGISQWFDSVQMGITPQQPLHQ